MPKIEASIEVKASKDRIWEIVSDLDNEPEYWYGTREVRNISKQGNVIDREITQNFRKHKILQKVTLHPQENIEINYVKGLTQGTKIISIESKSPDSQTLKVVWNAHFTGIYRLLTPWLEKHTRAGVISAIGRIKASAEGQSNTT